MKPASQVSTRHITPEGYAPEAFAWITGCDAVAARRLARVGSVLLLGESDETVRDFCTEQLTKTQ